jgi:hypothetical protein
MTFPFVLNKIWIVVRYTNLKFVKIVVSIILNSGYEEGLGFYHNQTNDQTYICGTVNLTRQEAN